MSEPVKIIASRDIHPLGSVMPIRNVRMRVVKKVVRHDYTTYFLVPQDEPDPEPEPSPPTRWERIKTWMTTFRWR